MTDAVTSNPPTPESDRLTSGAQAVLLLLALFGALVLWGSGVALQQDVSLLLLGRETVGVVTAHEAETTTTPATPRTDSSGRRADTASRGQRTDTVYRAIVAIDTEDGEARIRATILRGASEVLPIGTRVAVLYPAGRPGDGQIKAEAGSFWLHLLTAAIGLALVAGPLLVFLATGTWKLPGQRTAPR